jgi:hypothetical protein
MRVVPANMRGDSMKWTPWLFGSLTAVMMASCGGGPRDDAGTAGDAGTETGTMQGGTATDTSTAPAGAGTTSDTAHGGARMHGDTARATTGDSVGDSARVTSDTGTGTSQ